MADLLAVLYGQVLQVDPAARIGPTATASS